MRAIPSVIHKTTYRKRQNDFHFVVYVAPGACREAAVFLSHPFASAGGGYVKDKYFCLLL